MFCEKCGAANPDEAKFCESCGATLEAEQPAKENPVGDVVQNVMGNELVKKYMPIAIPVVAVVLVLVLLGVFGVFKSGPVKTLEKYNKAIMKGDGKAYYSAMIDPIELENMLDSEYNDYDDEEDVIDYYKDMAEDRKDYLEDEYGEDVKIKFEVRKKYNYKKDEVKEIAEYLEENYDYDEKDIDDIAVLKVREEIKGKDDDDADTREYVFAKIKGKWYLGVAGLYDSDSIEDIL